jgi:hypothetical protein
MKKTLFLIFLFALASLSQAQNLKTFGVGGYLQLGNPHENAGAIVQYRMDPNFAIDIVLSMDTESYSSNIRFLGIFDDIFKFPKGKANVYLGGGGGFAGWDGNSAVKLVGSIGLGYELPNAPVEIFAFVDPTFQKELSGGKHSGTDVTLKLGARYYFF